MTPSLARQEVCLCMRVCTYVHICVCTCQVKHKHLVVPNQIPLCFPHPSLCGLRGFVPFFISRERERDRVDSFNGQTNTDWSKSITAVKKLYFRRQYGAHGNWLCNIRSAKHSDKLFKSSCRDDSWRFIYHVNTRDLHPATPRFKILPQTETAEAHKDCQFHLNNEK